MQKPTLTGRSGERGLLVPGRTFSGGMPCRLGADRLPHPAMTDMGEIERRGSRVEDAVGGFPPGARAIVLPILVAPSEDRAKAIQQLYADDRSRDVAEFLMDLEGDDLTRSEVADALRRTP